MPKLAHWTFACLLMTFTSLAFAADKISLLIIDGQHNHAWAKTTPAIKEMLLKTDRFNVEVATLKDKQASEAFKPDFAKYQVVLMNYHGSDFSPDTQQAFEKFVHDGGGLVFYHAAIFSFQKWDNWNKMMGLGWRDNKFGDRISIDDAGKIVRTPKGEGPGASHGPAHEFEVMTREIDHPVMMGLPEKWAHVKDELYHGQRGPAENMTILATAFSAKDKGGTGTNEPMVWVVPVGKGRVFVSTLGHDVPAISDPNASAILVRGCEWAATGAVTIPAPK
ncbi:MAG: ThuA domain-containing protein [Tepidisphaeraceae bacterium]|jgi:type 1 glutamine amidotransferase